MILELLKMHGHVVGFNLVPDDNKEMCALKAIWFKFQHPNGEETPFKFDNCESTADGKFITRMCFLNSNVQKLDELSSDISTEEIKDQGICVYKPFNAFIGDKTWPLIIDHCDEEEYVQLDHILQILAEDKPKESLPTQLANITDDALKEEYLKRFHVLFGQVLQNIGRAVESGEIVIPFSFENVNKEENI